MKQRQSRLGFQTQQRKISGALNVAGHNLMAFSLFTAFAMLFSPNFAMAKKAKVSTPARQYKYEQKVLRAVEKDKYKRSLLPESGCMTREEYENLSRDIPDADKEVPEYQLPRDIKSKYVPQPTYKLVRYNNPPGTVDLHLERRFKFDRQVNGGAITSPSRDFLVYPVVYYYVSNQCTAGDLFVIPLDKSLPDVERISRANIIKKLPEPILSTEKETREKFTFRTMTPVDFSTDGTKLIAKEKIGNVNDGIWKTNLWVYDFGTKKARNLSEVRDAIRFYWRNAEGLSLDEKRWDITPLGFDAENPDRIIVSAFGYTGKTPKFLGNWSIDTQGERTQLVSLFDAGAKVSTNGFKIVQSGIVEPSEVHSAEKKQNKAIKKKRRAAKKALRADKKRKKKAFKHKLKDMKKEASAVNRQYSKQKRSFGQTAADGAVKDE